MLAIIISLALLYFLVGEFAPEQARPNRPRILAIAIAVLVLEVALMNVLPKSVLWALAVTAVAGTFVWLTLEKWLKIERRTAGKVAALYIGARVVLGFAIGIVQVATGGASA